MSRYDYYGHYYKPSQPISTDEGIKARSKRGAFVKNWWAARWIKALEQLVDAGRLRRGRTYARKGQVLSIEEIKSGLQASVQGSRRRAYKVSIQINTLNNSQWEQVIDVMSEQAIFTAQLLAGEMPQEIEEVFQAAGVSLFPEKKTELMTKCSCPDWANPCKHVAAVHYILGEQFDEDPFLLFRLRGRSQEQILEALRLRRAEAAGPEDDVDEVEAVVPLEETLTKFWDLGPSVRQLKTNIKPPVTEVPILKRLGQPTFLDDDLRTLLGPAYRAITESAMAAAYGDDNG